MMDALKIICVLLVLAGGLVLLWEVVAVVLDVLWQAFGKDRLMYGSNWPVSSRFAPYDQIQRIVTAYFAEKGEEATENYFWKNSKSAYKWVERS